MDALGALKKTRWSNPTSFFYSPGAMGGEDRLHPSAQGPLHTPAAGMQKSGGTPMPPPVRLKPGRCRMVPASSSPLSL